MDICCGQRCNECGTRFLAPHVSANGSDAVLSVAHLFLVAFAEEVLFRGLLVQLPTFKNQAEEGVSLPMGGEVPDKLETSRPPAGEQIAILAIFVMFHLDIMHAVVSGVFCQPLFLLMAAILGLCCQEALLRTQSLWPGTIMHWTWVCVFHFTYTSKD
mmetsp:Transcript_82445/g.143065  ORF Transcript_82445/g.143065 Transcript_82445/m.143065 type:complete len:158 (-) Transcript_82445:12-485(-)